MPLPLLSYLPDGVDSDAADAASAAVRSYCGWHIAPTTTQMLTLDGSGSSTLILPTLYLTAVTDVTNDGVAVDDVEWSQAGFARLYRWSCRLRGVTATITHGYDQCPAEVAAVVVALARQDGSAAAMQGVKSRQVGPLAWQYADDQIGGVLGVSGAMREVLDRYKLPSRP